MTVYQHFRREEREFLDQILNWRDMVERQHISKLTDFLDPREQFIVQSLIGSQGDVHYAFFGGTKDTERKRALLYPHYLQPTEDDFELTLFEVIYPKKFTKLEHSDVLGSLMGLGLTRGKFGDIILAEERVQFFTTNELNAYIDMHLQAIGRDTVSLEELPIEQALEEVEKWQERDVTASSLRVDVIINAIFHLSRQKSQQYIQKKIVRVNWKTIEDPSFVCAEGDVISVRGLGRAKVISLEGKSRKDRWQLKVGTLK